ncbi:hypothetical protein EDB80DRAFT_735572 [Ilyonectria destructans]|nr:hypothetical protein EDB80DRAFT_735572 [Ilyonectria destructans]
MPNRLDLVLILIFQRLCPDHVPSGHMIFANPGSRRIISPSCRPMADMPMSRMSNTSSTEEDIESAPPWSLICQLVMMLARRHRYHHPPSSSSCRPHSSAFASWTSCSHLLGSRPRSWYSAF